MEKGYVNMNFVTFIIPSIGRKTLANTISSLYSMYGDKSEWKSVICFDNVNPTCITNENIICINTPKKLGQGINNAGNVRNYAIDFAINKLNLSENSWISMLDDDDSALPEYLVALKEAISKEDPDVVIFKMKYADGTILPPNNIKDIDLLENKVGISFSIKRKVFDKVRFEPSNGEDFNFLSRLKSYEFKIFLSDWVTYNVSPLGIADDRNV